jgi:hypothetical protein
MQLHNRSQQHLKLLREKMIRHICQNRLRGKDYEFRISKIVMVAVDTASAGIALPIYRIEGPQASS